MDVMSKKRCFLLITILPHGVTWSKPSPSCPATYNGYNVPQKAVTCKPLTEF